MDIQFITHKGKRILFVDLSDCSPREIEKISLAVPSYVTAEPKGTVLLLADFTNAKLDKPAMEALKKSLVLDRPHLKRSAWIGTKSIPKVFYEHLKWFSQRELTSFNTREEALEWLASD